MKNFEISDKDEVKKLFIHQLNRVNCTKSNLLRNLPDLAGMVSFKNLRFAILESYEDVKKQQERVDDIYKLLDSKASDQGCEVIKSVIEEAYHFGAENNGLTHIIRDMDIILYMRLIENIELTSFGILKLINKFIGNDEVSQLLLECCNENVDNDKLFRLISEEYLNEVVQE
jgi:ferritin-like metal-binding protein YciE